MTERIHRTAREAMDAHRAESETASLETASLRAQLAQAQERAEKAEARISDIAEHFDRDIDDGLRSVASHLAYQRDDAVRRAQSAEDRHVGLRESIRTLTENHARELDAALRRAEAAEQESSAWLKARNEAWLQTNDLTAERSLLRAQLARLKEAGEGFEDIAVHWRDCDRAGGDSQRMCTCGLARAQRVWNDTVASLGLPPLPPGEVKSAGFDGQPEVMAAAAHLVGRPCAITGCSEPATGVCRCAGSAPHAVCDKHNADKINDARTTTPPASPGGGEKT